MLKQKILQLIFLFVIADTERHHEQWGIELDLPQEESIQVF